MALRKACFPSDHSRMDGLLGRLGTLKAEETHTNFERLLSHFIRAGGQLSCMKFGIVLHKCYTYALIRAAAQLTPFEVLLAARSFVKTITTKMIK